MESVVPTPTQRQLAMVMDLNKCIGCHTCTVACKTQWTNRKGREYMYWNNVETRPGDGWPRGFENMGGGFDAQGEPRSGKLPQPAEYGAAWEYDFENALMGEQTPWLRPDVKPEWGANWDEDKGAGIYPNSYYFYLPRICNHCSNPPCVSACPNKAVYKRDADGIVLIDQDKCQGVQACVAACPYKKIYFNASTGRSEKCIFCYPRLEQGLAPACAQQCVGRIRWVGFRDDEESPIHILVEKYKVALPLHAEWGTEPNVFYIPPTAPARYDADGRIDDAPRIPLAYLEELFGLRVGDALDTLARERDRKAAGRESELMDVLIAYRHAEMFKLA